MADDAGGDDGVGGGGGGGDDEGEDSSSADDSGGEDSSSADDAGGDESSSEDGGSGKSSSKDEGVKSGEEGKGSVGGDDSFIVGNWHTKSVPHWSQINPGQQAPRTAPHWSRYSRHVGSELNDVFVTANPRSDPSPCVKKTASPMAAAVRNANA
jgi:hypothetical protein